MPFIFLTKETTMQIYHDTASILVAASTHPDIQLRHLLTQRIESLGEHLPCLLQVLVLQAGDTAAAMATCLGLCPDCLKLPCPDPELSDFCPPWEVIEAYGRWFELTFLRGDDGAGVVVFVPDTADVELLAMCRMYAITPGGQP